MIKSIIRIAIILAGVLIVVLGRGLFFYSGSYSAPPTEMPGYESIVVPPVPTSEFSDVYEEGKGVILVDLAHHNAFDKEELNVLILRLVSRGLTIKFFSAEDDLEKELLGEGEGEEEEEEEEEEALEEELPGEEENLADEPLGEGEGEEGDLKEEPISEKQAEEEPIDEEAEEVSGADAFIVISPRYEFSKDEKETVGKFVDEGGKLLLIADPPRYGEMNSLSMDFGLLFEPDYLYNMKENEINYKNIFVTEFKENDITKELEKIALYTAGSISSANSSISFVDENTFSSVVETRKRLSPIALAQESKVLAIYDLTFITEPYNGILDNNQLISNVADWLMSTVEGAEIK
ncbi:hypothetical protein ACFLWS_04340 [Chloroflexota bacterium]